jgi:hypothetical protein
MKRLILIATLCLATAALAFAGDLTKAAKDAKSKRKRSTSKVLTNADVKNSKGKIAETPNLPETVERQPTMTEQHEARKAADKAAEERRATQAQSIADLEKELAAIEQQYFEENDLDRRDTEIVKKFNDAKARLDVARAQVP